MKTETSIPGFEDIMNQFGDLCKDWDFLKIKLTPKENTAMTTADVVNKLIGNIRPAGASHLDDERFENLKAMCALVEELTGQISSVANDYQNNYEHSIKRSCDYAQAFMKEIK